MEFLILLTQVIIVIMLSSMRHTNATSWILTPLVAIALAGGAAALDTVQTIEGETYEQCKVLKVEEEGVIVKHTRGIAKIPFYELDDTTRKQLGHTGEVKAPIRYSNPPEGGLIPDIEGDEVQPHDLDLDLDRSEQKDNGRTASHESASAAKKPASKKKVVRRAVVQAKPAVAHRVKPRRAVGVSGVGVYSPKRRAAAAAAGRHKHKHGGYHHKGCGHCDLITTRYTPYGNFSYRGGPPHWYLFYNPPCNRRQFERVDYRRWQHGR